MTVDDIVVFGVTGAVLVYTLVQLAKAWGLPDGWGQQAASIAAIVVATAWEANSLYPDQVGPYIKAAIAALLLFSSSVGLYHLGQGSSASSSASTKTKTKTNAPQGPQNQPPAAPAAPQS